MCYHVSTPAKEKLQDYLGDDYKVGDYEGYHHVTGFAYPNLPAITSESPKVIKPIIWGLIPSWAKDTTAANDIRGKTLNATCEGIFEKPSFKGSIKSKRCLLLVDGFYEWEHRGKEKVPYYIYMDDKLTFAMAGIWSSWTDRSTGEVLDTCSIITTTANELLAKIHNTKKRMPVVLRRNVLDSWLDASLPSEQVTSHMMPLPDGLKAHTISKLITSRIANSNVPEVKDEYPYI